VTDKLVGDHVDQGATAAEVKLPDSFGWQFIGPHGEAPFRNTPLPPLIRQIAFEVLDTVEREELVEE
jgi:hypothetical protein